MKYTAEIQNTFVASSDIIVLFQIIPDAAVPFGGYKQSGWGRENGYESLLQYTELKSVVAKL